VNAAAVRTMPEGMVRLVLDIEHPERLAKPYRYVSVIAFVNALSVTCSNDPTGEASGWTDRFVVTQTTRLGFAAQVARAIATSA
jgi:hypothetical protein